MLVSKFFTNNADGDRAAVRIAVGLDDQCCGACGQRCRLAATAEFLNGGWISRVVGAVDIDVGVRTAQRPAEVARSKQVDRATRLGDTTRAQGGHRVVAVAAVAQLEPVLRGLRVTAERRARTDRDDVGCARGRTDAVHESGVTRAGNHDDAGFHQLLVEDRSRVVSGVGELVAAERLVDDVGVVVRDRPVEGAEESPS